MTARRHRIDWLGAGLCGAARRQGVELPVSYARRLAAEALAHDADLGITPLGSGVVIHTAPEREEDLPVIVGYADARGKWYRDGSRHIATPDVEHALAVPSEEVAL